MLRKRVEQKKKKKRKRYLLWEEKGEARIEKRETKKFIRALSRRTEIYTRDIGKAGCVENKYKQKKKKIKGKKGKGAKKGERGKDSFLFKAWLHFTLIALVSIKAKIEEAKKRSWKCE